MPQPAPILRALEALKSLDRRTADACLREELALPGASADRLRNIVQLAVRAGSIGVEIEAMRRLAQMPPVTLEKVLEYCQVLAKYGRTAAVSAVIDRLSTPLRDLPPVCHLLGTVASQTGDFEEAERLFRKALEQAPLSAVTWHALSVVKTYSLGDPDIPAMEAILPEVTVASPSAVPQMLYALAKAYDDAGLKSTATEAYGRGAAIARAHIPFDPTPSTDYADRTVREFTPAAMTKLKASGCERDRVIFVNGLPRSGTTLVEEILNRHPDVYDGGEVNLVSKALMPTGDFTLPAALAFQEHATCVDPWGDIGRDYHNLVSERFGVEGRIVDKTLNQARFMGLLLHALPKVKVIWLRRNPDDCALSCFRTFFTESVPWSWSFDDIAAHFRAEDNLYHHWINLFPDRILTVPYEDLVRDPDIWIRRLLDHVGLDVRPEVFERPGTKRSVMTASVAQVRAPISTARIGSAEAYGSFLDAFRRAYYA